MTDVPNDARAQIEALLHNQPVGYERQGNKHPPPWLCRLALRMLDLEAAASEAVTKEMVNAAWDAHADGAASEVLANPGQIHEALLAVAPALVLAGERRGLERAAADFERRADDRCAEADACDADGDSAGAEVARNLASHYRLTALELRALGRPA